MYPPCPCNQAVCPLSPWKVHQVQSGPSNLAMLVWISAHIKYPWNQPWKYLLHIPANSLENNYCISIESILKNLLYVHVFMSELFSFFLSELWKLLLLSMFLLFVFLLSYDQGNLLWNLLVIHVCIWTKIFVLISALGIFTPQKTVYWFALILSTSNIIPTRRQ